MYLLNTNLIMMNLLWRSLYCLLEGKKKWVLKLPGWGLLGAAWRQTVQGGRTDLEPDCLLKPLPLLFCAFGKNDLNALSFDVSSLSYKLQCFCDRLLGGLGKEIHVTRLETDSSPANANLIFWILEVYTCLLLYSQFWTYPCTASVMSLIEARESPKVQWEKRDWLDELWSEGCLKLVLYFQN